MARSKERRRCKKCQFGCFFGPVFYTHDYCGVCGTATKKMTPKALEKFIDSFEHTPSEVYDIEEERGPRWRLRVRAIMMRPKASRKRDEDGDE